MLEQAIAIANRGWRVLPVNGKHPIPDEWPTRATTDHETIRAWWAQYQYANIGIATGAQSNLLVLDVDPGKGGEESLRELEDQFGALPQTIEVVTGGGGRHIYFTDPGLPIHNSSSELAAGLDIKTNGGQVVAPPSIHPDTGRAYAWEAAHHPDDVVVPAEAPPWLLQKLTALEAPAGHGFVSPERITKGARNDTLYKSGRSLKARHYSRTAILGALQGENQEKCDPPFSTREVEDIVESVWSGVDRPAFTQNGTPAPGGTQEADETPDLPAVLGVGLGQFLGQVFLPIVSLIEGLLTNSGGGWISGEEKLGKSFYALLEALCLALGLPVCGRFEVPTRVRVLFIEEEDSPARLHTRVIALLRGLNIDPDDPHVRADLDEWFQISVWSGFTLDDAPHVQQLHHTIATFRPTVVYIDVLRKVTTRDLNKGDQAGALLKVLDDLRREFSVLFRALAHNRKIQGSFRAGRGSQEIAGSYQLGAWAENSLFFEPIGKTGRVKVTVQRKDGAQVLPFGLRFEAEGPEDNPTLVRLHADELSTVSAVEVNKERIFEVLPGLTVDEASDGSLGVSIETICTAVSLSASPVRKAVKELVDDGRLREVGKVGRGCKLYWVVTP
jgi:hypothetical protein